MTSNNTGSGAGDRGRINVRSSRNDGTAYQAGYVDIDRSSGTDDKAHLLVALNNGSGVGEKLRITPDQVLIGTTTSSGYTNRQLVVGDTSTSSSFIEIRCSSSGTGHLLFADSAAGDANNYTGYILSLIHI